MVYLIVFFNAIAEKAIIQVIQILLIFNDSHYEEFTC